MTKPRNRDAKPGAGWLFADDGLIAEPETITAVRRSNPSWDGLNRSILREALRTFGVSEEVLRSMTQFDVRMRFAVAQLPLLRMMGEQNTVTSEIVSALPRTIDEPDAKILNILAEAAPMSLSAVRIGRVLQREESGVKKRLERMRGDEFVALVRKHWTITPTGRAAINADPEGNP